MLKKSSYILVTLSLTSISLRAQVGIGTTNLDNSEALRIESNNKGVLLPNLSIPDLSQPSPVLTTPPESLFVYNTNTTTDKGFYFWKNNKWNPLLDSTNVYYLLGLAKSETVFSTSNVIDDSTVGAITYTQNEAPSAHDWVLIPGLSKTITINRPNNNLSINIFGTTQTNSSNSSDDNFITYSIGIFIDGQLNSVRNYVVSGPGKCVYGDYSINSNVSNLKEGNHTIEAYETMRVRFSSSLSQKYGMSFGGKYSTCNNISDLMARSLLNIQITEH